MQSASCCCSKAVLLLLLQLLAQLPTTCRNSTSHTVLCVQQHCQTTRLCIASNNDTSYTGSQGSRRPCFI